MLSSLILVIHWGQQAQANIVRGAQIEEPDVVFTGSHGFPPLLA